MHPDVQIIRKLFADAKSLHEALYDAITPVVETVKKNTYDDPVLADLGFLMREFENLLDDWRKDSKARKELIGKLLALRLVTTDASSVKGQLCSARPEMRMRPNFPGKESQDYFDLCRFFGVDPVNTPIRLSWQGIEKYCTRQFEEGKPLPPGMKEPKAEYSCIFTRRQKNGSDGH